MIWIFKRVLTVPSKFPRMIAAIKAVITIFQLPLNAAKPPQLRVPDMRIQKSGDPLETTDFKIDWTPLRGSLMSPKPGAGRKSMRKKHVPHTKKVGIG